MKTEQEIRDKIEELKKYEGPRHLYFDQSIHDLKWVLDECECECNNEEEKE